MQYHFPDYMINEWTGANDTRTFSDIPRNRNGCICCCSSVLPSTLFQYWGSGIWCMCSMGLSNYCMISDRNFTRANQSMSHFVFCETIQIVSSIKNEQKLLIQLSDSLFDVFPHGKLNHWRLLSHLGNDYLIFTPAYRAIQYNWNNKSK